jgi:hypothetical protein
MGYTINSPDDLPPSVKKNLESGGSSGGTSGGGGSSGGSSGGGVSRELTPYERLRSGDTGPNVDTSQGESWVGGLSGGGAGGTFVRAGKIVYAGRGSTVGRGSSTSGYYSGFEEPGFVNRPSDIENEIRKAQERQAVKYIGKIRNIVVDDAKGERTFIGMGGKKYTFPKYGLSFGQQRRQIIGVQENGNTRWMTEGAFSRSYQKEAEKISTDLFERQQKADFEEFSYLGRIGKTYTKMGLNVTYDSKGNLWVRDKNKETVFTGEDFIAHDEKGNRILVENAKYLSSPFGGGRVETSFIPTRAQQKENEKIGMEKYKLKEYGKTLIGKIDQFTKMPRDMISSVWKGYTNMVNASTGTDKDAKDLSKLLYKAKILFDEAKNYQKNPTKYHLNNFKKARTGYLKQEKLIKSLSKRSQAKYKLVTAPETKIFLATLGLAGLSAGAGALVAYGGVGSVITGRLIQGGLSGYGTYMTARQSKETIKNPSLENIGGLIFYGLPTALSIRATLKKALSPSYKGTVENVRLTKKALELKKAGYIKLRSSQPKARAKYINYNKAAITREISKINREIAKLNKILKDPQILKATSFNPRVRSKIINAMQSSFRTLYHVSGQPKINKLTGQWITKTFNPKNINKIMKKAQIVQPKILKDLRGRGKIEKSLINQIKKNNGIVYGGRAISLYTNKFMRFLLGRKKTVDFDIFMKGARGKAKLIVDTLNKQFKTKLFTVKPALHKGTYKIFYKKKNIADISEIEKGTKFVKTKGGLKVRVKSKELERKIYATIERRFNLKKGYKEPFTILDKIKLTGKSLTDYKDVLLLSNFKIQFKDIFNRNKNPRDIFEVIENPGVGQISKSRLKFKEQFLFSDIEAAKAYGYGKKYSILEIKTRISKYPKKLQSLIKKAEKGLLSASKQIKLRKALALYVKKNPGKFYPGSRTSAMGFGERELVAGAMTKLKKLTKYKFFDKDAQKFLQLGVFSRNLKAQKINFVKKLIGIYNKNPLLRLKARLSNPDLKLVWKYNRMLNKNIKLKSRDNLKINEIIRKFFTSKKASQGKLNFKANKKRYKIMSADLRLLMRRQIKKIPFSVQVRNLAKIRLYGNKYAARKERPMVRKVIRKLSRRTNIRLDARDRVIIRRALRTAERLRMPVRAREPVRSRNRKTPTRQRIRIPERTRVPERQRIRAPVRIRVTPRVIKRLRTIIPRTKIPRIIRQESEDKYVKGKMKYKSKKKRLYVYLADLLSILRGVRAKKSQTKMLKKVGRLFTGFEIRPQVAY